MMQRITAILALSVYTLLSVVGYIAIHSCHGNVHSIAINNSDPAGCCDTDGATCCNACENLEIEVDFKPDQNIVQIFSLDRVSEFDLLDFVFTDNIPETNSDKESYSINKSPPGESLPEIYLLNTSFLFYG